MSKILWGKVELPNIKKLTINHIKILWKYSKVFKIDAILLLIAIGSLIYWVITNTDISGIIGIMVIYISGVIIRLGVMRDKINKLELDNGMTNLSNPSTYNTTIQNGQ